MRTRRGFSPVIATVVLAAVVLAIGGSVWYYAIGASTVVANSYVDETLDGLYEVTERFIIEHMYYNSSTDIMHIWVYNYGKMKITVNASIYVNDIRIKPLVTTPLKDIEAKSMELIDIICPSPLVSVDVFVKLYSKRQNNVYATYYVP